MKSGTMRSLAVLATGAAMALSFPVAGAIAGQGGVPHSEKPCPTKSKGHGPKNSAPNDKGKKCGFNR